MLFPGFLDRIARALAAAFLLAVPLVAEAADDESPEPSPAASEMLQSMREKGLLSETEYEDLYRRQARYEAEERAREALPGWARDWTFGGDMRLRYDRRNYGELPFGDTFVPGRDNILVGLPADPDGGTGTGTEDRLRLRLRLGAEKRITDAFTFGFRVATSAATSYGDVSPALLPGYSFRQTFDSDPRRQNATFGDLFAPESIFLDRAYLRWSPDRAPTLDVNIGKFANPFLSRHFAGDIVWDPDIQPEGLAIDYRFDFLPDALWTEATGGLFTLSEVADVTLFYNPTTREAVSDFPDPDDADAFMFGLQGGIHVRPVDWVQAGARVSYYDVQRISARLAVAFQNLGNGGEAIDDNPLIPGRSFGRAEGRLDELVIDLYATFTPWGERWALTPFVQTASILSAESEDRMWAFGATFGTPEFVRLTAMWARIERNGTMSLFTDSNLFDGFTNVKGWFVSAEREIVRGVRVRGSFITTSPAEEECAAADRGLENCDIPSQIENFGLYRQTTLDRTRWQFDVLVDF